MSKKNVIMFIATIIYIFLNLLFFIFFQYPEMVNDNEKNAKQAVSNICFELKFYNLINDSTIKSLPANLLFAVWLKEKDTEWQPVLYNKKRLSKNDLIKPDYIPEKIKTFTKNFITKININGSSFQSIIWLNNFNIEYYIQFIILPLLFSILNYSIIIIIIEILFSEKKITADIQNDQSYNQGLNDQSEENLINKQNLEAKNSQGLIDEYKTLWTKNFKVNDNFKNNFSFDKIYNLVRFGIKPEQYIKNSLEIANNYFGWKNPKFYIKQKNIFIDSITKETLNPNQINIPSHGDQKGSLFIPLYPYNMTELFGYFNYEWNNEEKFDIASILYFLKFFFSEKAKSIFLNYTLLENVLNIIENKLSNSKDVTVSIIEVDKKDKFLQDFDSSTIKNLNEEIKDRIINYFNNEIIFKISSFTFLIISENIEKNQQIQKINKWINDTEKQLYNVSREYGNIALTYSCGISLKNDRTLHPLTMINEAEDKVKESIKNGGNRISY